MQSFKEFLSEAKGEVFATVESTLTQKDLELALKGLGGKVVGKDPDTNLGKGAVYTVDFSGSGKKIPELKRALKGVHGIVSVYKTVSPTDMARARASRGF